MAYKLKIFYLVVEFGEVIGDFMIGNSERRSFVEEIKKAVVLEVAIVFGR